MNTLPCDRCKHFDPPPRPTQSGDTRPALFGYCAKRSAYPAVDPPGDPSPDGVARVAEGEAPRYKIVLRLKVVPDCRDARRA